MPRGWVLFWTYCLVFCGLLGCGLVSVFNLEQLSVSVILNVSAPLSSLRYFHYACGTPFVVDPQSLDILLWFFPSLFSLLFCFEGIC